MEDSEENIVLLHVDIGAERVKPGGHFGKILEREIE